MEIGEHGDRGTQGQGDAGGHGGGGHGEWWGWVWVFCPRRRVPTGFEVLEAPGAPMGASVGQGIGSVGSGVSWDPPCHGTTVPKPWQSSRNCVSISWGSSAGCTPRCTPAPPPSPPLCPQAAGGPGGGGSHVPG